MEKSIAIFQFCIKLYTDWSDHAMLAELFCNMGNAYVKRITGSREENLETAFMYYEKAAAWISERSDPDKWAMLQFNLGVCEHKRNHIETAVMFFRNCLRYYNALTNPEHFAKANMELGDIFYTNCLNAGKVSDMLAEALNCYENAISYFESEDFPEECANIRLRMALVMKKRYELFHDDSLLPAKVFYEKVRASDLPDTQEAAQIYEELGKYFKHEQKALQ